MVETILYVHPFNLFFGRLCHIIYLNNWLFYCTILLLKYSNNRFLFNSFKSYQSIPKTTFATLSTHYGWRVFNEPGCLSCYLMYECYSVSNTRALSIS